MGDVAGTGSVVDYLLRYCDATFALRIAHLCDAKGEQALLRGEDPHEENEGEGGAREHGNALGEDPQGGEEAAKAHEVGRLREALQGGGEAEEEHCPAHLAAVFTLAAGEEGERRERDERPQERGEPAEVHEASELETVGRHAGQRPSPQGEAEALAD